MMQAQTLESFYRAAHDWVVEHGYVDDIEWAEGLDLAECTPQAFLGEYLWTVITSGLKIEGAGRTLYKKFEKEGKDAIRHPAKRRAIERGLVEYHEWFRRVKELSGDTAQLLAYLDSLPHIGRITKYQLAQNIGIPVAKPDRWLLRVGYKFGYSSTPSPESATDADLAKINEMCSTLAARTGEKVRTVDVVIWRYCEAGNFDYGDYAK